MPSAPETPSGNCGRRADVRGVLACLALLLASALRPVPAAPQPTPLEIPGGVPESPAFRFLGTTPGSVTRPTSTRDLGAAILHAVDGNGRLVQGLALDLTPWVFWPGLSIPPADYRHRGWKYLLANTQVSLGTARGTDDAAATDAAAGLRLTVYDGADPMADSAFVDSLGTALLGCLPGPDDPDVDPGQVQACTDAATSTALDRYVAARWNAARLALGVAAGLRIQPDGGATPAGTDYSGFRSWATGALPVGRRGQLLAQVEYSDRPALDAVAAENRLSYGGRLIVGSGSADLFLEAVGALSWLDEERDGSAHWSAGVEVRVAQNLWVSTGVGRRYSDLTQPNEAFVVANIRLGVTSANRFDALRGGL